MGDLIEHPGSNTGALIAQDPEAVARLREQRLQEAQVLEEKLRQINEELPTKIHNVVGSCAGAGSGDFHYYRQIRRAEQDRVRRLEAEEKAASEQEAFETKRQAAQAELDARAAKKRAKRQKKKAKKKQKGGSAGGDGANSDSSGSDSDGEAAAAAAAAAGKPPVPKQQDLD